MVRTFVFSLTGAGVGFFVGSALVAMMSGGQPAHDTAFVCLFFGSLLAGAGAVAGAIIGGVADLLSFFRNRDT